MSSQIRPHRVTPPGTKPGAKRRSTKSKQPDYSLLLETKYAEKVARRRERNASGAR